MATDCRIAALEVTAIGQQPFPVRSPAAARDYWSLTTSCLPPEPRTLAEHGHTLYRDHGLIPPTQGAPLPRAAYSAPASSGTRILRSIFQYQDTLPKRAASAPDRVASSVDRAIRCSSRNTNPSRNATTSDIHKSLGGIAGNQSRSQTSPALMNSLKPSSTWDVPMRVRPCPSYFPAQNSVFRADVKQQCYTGGRIR